MTTRLNNLKEFEALRAVILSGTTTEAARKLGASQSSISRHIAQLEAQVGYTLFEREAGRITPTAMAMSLNEKLDPLFEALAKINQEDLNEAPIKILRVMATPTLAHRFLIPIIKMYIAENKNRRLSVEVSRFDAIENAILDGHCDLGLMAVTCSRIGLKTIPFRYSRAVCVMPQSHALSEFEVIRPENLTGHDFIALNRRLAGRIQLERILATSDTKLKPIIEVSTGAAAFDLVRAGTGIAIINPFPFDLRTDENVVVRPFEPKIEHRSIFVVPGAQPPSSQARLFMRYIKMNTPKTMFSEPL